VLIIFNTFLAFFTEILYNMIMRQSVRFFWLFTVILMMFPAGLLSAQNNAREQYARRYQNGTQFYNLSRWQEAAVEFRRAQEIAANNTDWSRALYWVILSQMAYSDFGSALRDMEDLERRAPSSPYTRDMYYHRARVYYNQGFFEDALFFFNKYNSLTSDTDRESSDRRAASFFWMGESLYSMSQFDEAEKFYAWVVGRYPESPKIEAASYRLDLIKQKKIEAELLALLQWSHEESLRTSEEHQRTIRTYEHTLNIYQRRIAELSAQERNIIPRNEEPALPAVNNEYIIPAETVTPVFIPENNLIERARALENEIQSIIRRHNAGGQ